VGCAVYLTKLADGSHTGSTRMDHCKNAVGGAAWAKTTYKIREDHIVSWVQGYTTEKEEVWESENKWVKKK